MGSRLRRGGKEGLHGSVLRRGRPGGKRFKRGSGRREGSTRVTVPSEVCSEGDERLVG